MSDPGSIIEIAPEELRRWIGEGRHFVLLDVLTEESFAAEHLPGAIRAGVYETNFLDQVPPAAREHPVVVYGTSERSLASRVAAEKLAAAGYPQVYDMRGGLEAWRAAGFEAQGRPPAPPVPPSGVFTLDIEKSLARWMGRNLLNFHEGTVQFASGKITLREGELEDAEFALDLRTIRNTDLTDPAWNAMLLRHLMSADFFEVDRWPLAKFVAKTAAPIAGAAEGSANFWIAGDFTLRGQTHEIAFPAVIGVPDGVTLSGQAVLDLDRTRWGALYGSGRFFERLGKHLVNDIVHLHLKMIATKSAADI